jgi:DNA polymerase III delta prime subunit
MENIPNNRVKKILSSIGEDRSRLQHLLFYGPPGSGKTSTAKIFIESWYTDGKIPPGAALFLNASDERGLESMRMRVFPFLESRVILPEQKPCPRFLVFDEAETLTASAQLALRSFLQKTAYHCCILFLVNTLSGVEKSLHHRFLRIRFDPLPSETLTYRVKLYKPDFNSPTPLDALRLRGDLRIFLHAPNAAERLATTVYKWLNARTLPDCDTDRGTIEDLFWLGAVFNVLNIDDVRAMTEASQAGTLKSMPHLMQLAQINEFRKTILKKLDPRREL